jgi:hypothetical protein
MSEARVRELLVNAVPPGTLRPAGLYTKPPSWGVYEIAAPRPTATRSYRFGNHPVREMELRREFGVVKAIAHFTVRSHAEELAKLLNAGYSL